MEAAQGVMGGLAGKVTLTEVARKLGSLSGEEKVEGSDRGGQSRAAQPGRRSGCAELPYGLPGLANIWGLAGWFPLGGQIADGARSLPGSSPVC